MLVATACTGSVGSGGTKVGKFVGEGVGAREGRPVGTWEGAWEGAWEGTSVAAGIGGRGGIGVVML